MSVNEYELERWRPPTSPVWDHGRAARRDTLTCTLQEACRILNVTPNTVRAWMGTGRLDSIERDGCRRPTVDSLDRIIGRRR